MRVLLVDDEKELVTTLSERLFLRGIQADWATSGQEALAKSEAGEYDVIVVDMKMPGLSGLEVMRRIRARRPAARFVVLTGHSDEIDWPGEEGGTAFIHLIKPVEIETFIDTLRQVGEG